MCFPGRTRRAEGKAGRGDHLVLLFVGAFNAAWPTGAWYLEVGWKFRDAEPSDAALGWNRARMLALIVAVILIIA